MLINVCLYRQIARAAENCTCMIKIDCFVFSSLKNVFWMQSFQTCTISNVKQLLIFNVKVSGGSRGGCPPPPPPPFWSFVFQAKELVLNEYKIFLKTLEMVILETQNFFKKFLGKYAPRPPPPLKCSCLWHLLVPSPF